MKKIIWVFEESKWYGFVIPNDKREYIKKILFELKIEI